ncbi:transposable element Tcb1 transposase [Trichonephila clavipes]|nr:transposable element Tcb1 transposase [Trichonephila clavipes]
MTRIVQRFFVNHQIELLPWPARSPYLSPIENVWSRVAQRLTQTIPPAATPDQLWQRVEAAWSDVPQEHIQSIFESMARCVAEICSNPILRMYTIGSEASQTSSLSSSLARGLAVRWIFRVPPCRTSTIQFQASMPSPVSETRSYDTV